MYIGLLSFSTRPSIEETGILEVENVIKKMFGHKMSIMHGEGICDKSDVN